MVDITVNGRRHAVQCGNGEEARVKGLASYIDRKIQELAIDGPQIGDARLMLLASLMIADELSDAYDKIKELEESQGAAPPPGIDSENERRAAALVEQVAEQLNAVAVELERA
jgi:cell division protein ZapA